MYGAMVAKCFATIAQNIAVRRMCMRTLRLKNYKIVYLIRLTFPI